MKQKKRQKNKKEQSVQFIYYKKKDNGEGYCGKVMYQGVPFRFTLNPQKKGEYRYRGRISAISLEDGTVLQVKGAERSKRLKDIDGDLTERQKRDLLAIRCEFYSKTDRQDDVMAIVSKKVMQLYFAHASQLTRHAEKSIRADQIDLQTAVGIYGEQFLRDYQRKNPKMKKTTLEQYGRNLKKNCTDFPAMKPMCEITEQMAGKATKEFSHQAVKVLFLFWAYCLNRGHCTGACPVEAKSNRKKRKSAAALQRKAQIPAVIPTAVDERLCQMLLQDAAEDGLSCATALERYGGFSPNDIIKLTWGDILFDSNDPDCVRVRHIIEGNAGATHDYTRPIMVQGARILHARHNKLLESFKEEQLKKLPVVSKAGDLPEAATVDEIVRHDRQRLRFAGLDDLFFDVLKEPRVAVSRKLLHNSYEYDLYHKCGLTSGSADALFLCSKSLRGDVTGDHYTSMTDRHGQELLYARLKLAGPAEPIPKQEITGDEKSAVIAPEATDQVVDAKIVVTIPPGGRIDLSSRYGCNGSFSARGIAADGHIRRKSGRKKLEESPK